jgi:hypothetical protein
MAQAKTNGAHSKHSIPTCLVPLWEELYTHTSVQHAGAGAFQIRSVGAEGSRVEVKTVDAARRLVTMEAYHGGVCQRYFIVLKEGVEHTQAFGTFLSNYTF